MEEKTPTSSSFNLHFYTISQVGHLFFSTYLRTMSSSFSVNTLHLCELCNWINDLSFTLSGLIGTIYICERLVGTIYICERLVLCLCSKLQIFLPSCHLFFSWLIFFSLKKFFWFLQSESYQFSMVSGFCVSYRLSTHNIKK